MGSVPSNGVVQAENETQIDNGSNTSSAVNTRNVGGPIIRTTGQKQERKTILIGKIKVSVVRGNIVDEQVDVIVNSAVKELKLHDGRASAALLQTAGQSIQAECDQKYPGGIKHGQIAVTSGGKLSCKHVYHASLPKYANVGDEKGVKDIIITCLKQAHSDKMESVAIPAFGTGFLGYPSVSVAVQSFLGVEEFVKSISSTTIKSVFFVVFHKDLETVKNFLREAKRRAKPTIVPVSNRVSASAVFGNTDVNVVLGDMSKEQVDVIVSNSGQHLKLSKASSLTKSLLKVAGDSLQDECDQKYGNGIEPGDIAVTGGHNLQCKNVFHGYIPHWYSKLEVIGNLLPEEVLYNFVTDCLSEAGAKRLKSIAFPAIGTGVLLKYPTDIVAGNIIQAIQDYVKNNSSTSITEVRIVIFGGVSGWQDIEQFLSLSNRQYTLNLNHKLDMDVAFKHELTGEISTPIGKVIQGPAPRRGSRAFYKWKYREEISPPPYWTHFTSAKSLKDWQIGNSGKSIAVIDIPLNSNIANAIIHTFHQCGMNRSIVQKIQRVESLTLYETYVQECKRLFRKAYVDGSFVSVRDTNSSSGEPKTTATLDRSIVQYLYPEINEHYFFHGTKVNYVSAIAQHGLDNRLAAIGNFGKGIYGAEKSSKSAAYVDRGVSGESYMFLMRMCLGDIYTTSLARPNLTRPPCRVCGNAICSDHSELYDSVMAELMNREFVVYDQNQVYPEYLITYT